MAHGLLLNYVYRHLQCTEARYFNVFTTKIIRSYEHDDNK